MLSFSNFFSPRRANPQIGTSLEAQLASLSSAELLKNDNERSKKILTDCRAFVLPQKVSHEDHLEDLRKKLGPHLIRAEKGKRDIIDLCRASFHEQLFGDEYLPLIGGIALKAASVAFSKNDLICAHRILNDVKPLIEKVCSGYGRSGLYFLYGRIAEAAKNGEEASRHYLKTLDVLTKTPYQIGGGIPLTHVLTDINNFAQTFNYTNDPKLMALIYCHQSYLEG